MAARGVRGVVGAMKVRGLLFAIALLLGVWVAAVPWAFSAEEECVEYTIIPFWDTAHPYRGSNAAAVCNAWANGYNAAGSDGSNVRSGSASVSGSTCHWSGSDTTTCIEPGYPTGCGVPSPYTQDAEIYEGPGECEEDECSGKAGQDAFVGMNAGGGSGSYCANGCAVNVPVPTLRVICGLDGACSSKSIYKSTFTGASCSSEDPVDEGSCTVGPFGRMCASSPSGKNCGTFNGDRVCVEAIPSGCQSYASGGVACVVEGPGATTAVPDSGTPDDPATPTMSVSKDGKTVNYYSSATVNSSTTVTTGGAASGSDQGVETGGDDEAPDGCADGGCEGTVPELGEVQTFEGATSAFMGRVGEAPIVASVADLGDALPAGACPSWTIDVFDREISLSAPMCTIWDSVAGLLSAVMLVAWGLLAARIVLTA